MSQQWVLLRWNRMLHRAASLSRESVSLATCFARQPKPRSVRNLLVEQARQSNQTAVDILMVDKEIGLMRYYGVVGYIQEKKWLSLPSSLASLMTGSSSSSSTASSSSSSTTTTQRSISLDSTTLPTKNDNNDGPDKRKVAQVAFMVTSSMRAELTDRLGFTVADIRKLTPLQASLILQHDVTPSQQSTRVPDLVKAHQQAVEEYAAQAQEERVILEQQQQQQQQEAVSAEQSQSSQPPSSLSPPVTPLGTTTFEQSETPTDESQLLVASGTAAVNDSHAQQQQVHKSTYVFDDVPTPNEQQEASSSPLSLEASKSQDAAVGDKEVWYEIVELSSDDNSNNTVAVEVVALYKSEKEAALGLETIQLFAARRAKDHGLDKADSTFEIRKALK